MQRPCSVRIFPHREESGLLAAKRGAGATCYVPMEGDRFPILLPQEEDGFVVERDTDSKRFLEG